MTLHRSSDHHNKHSVTIVTTFTVVDLPSRPIHHCLFLFLFKLHRFFFRRNNESGDSGAVAVERPKSAHQIAREIRMQKVKQYEAKVMALKAAEEKERNDLLLSIVPNTDKVTTPSLADAATETNSPGNSDNDEDPTINDDDDDEEEEAEEENDKTRGDHEESQQQQQQSPEQSLSPSEPTTMPGSPLSILSMNTKPVLIHPPRSISRVNDDNTTTVDDNNNTNNDSCSHSHPLGLLCGCI
jgi:hypothetical protein